MNQTDPRVEGLFSAIRGLLIGLGGALALAGLQHSGVYFWIMIGSGSIMTVGPAAWGVYSAAMNIVRARAVGAQAGINMTVAGKALAADGVSVVSKNDGATPPLPVTLATASKIVADFGPASSTIARA